MYAIGIEKHFVHELHLYGEITERVMRRLMTKLSTQRSRLERSDEIDPYRGKDQRDWFERLAFEVRRLLPVSDNEQIEEDYMYYRAKAIISRKVVKELQEVEKLHVDHFFDSETFEETIRLYEGFRDAAVTRTNEISQGYRAIIEPLNKRLATRGLLKAGESIIDDLSKKEMITPKLAIMLHNDFEEESERLVR